MDDLKKFCCQNKNCPKHGVRGEDNIRVRTTYGPKDMGEKADFLLNEMLKRQAEGKFHNGVTDAAGQGIDWTDWQGNPTGYEGYLAESCRFLQAIMLREPHLRAKHYAPILNLENYDDNE